MIRIASILFATLLPVAASAQTPFMHNYLHPTDDADRILAKTYLEGLRDGVMASNEMMTVKRYCMPEGVLLSDELADAAIRGWAKKQTPGPSLDNFPVAVALIDGLKETFPCKK
jgi:hypothetical protein